MKVTIDTKSLWGLVKMLNDRSQVYSQLADEISEALKQLESNNKEGKHED